MARSIDRRTVLQTTGELLGVVLLAGIALYKQICRSKSLTVSPAVNTFYRGVRLLSPVLALLAIHPTLSWGSPRFSGAGFLSMTISPILVVIALSLGSMLIGFGCTRTNTLPGPGGSLLVVPGLMWISLILEKEKYSTTQRNERSPSSDGDQPIEVSPHV